MTFSYIGAFVAGLLTFVSPCVLPLAPILTATFVAGSRSDRWSRLKATAWFVIGFSVVFVLMGIGVSALVQKVAVAKPVLLGIGGLVFIAFGLKMARVVSFDFEMPLLARTSDRLQRWARKLPHGLHGLAFGSLFAVSWTPCVGPVIGGVLTHVASSKGDPMEGALLLSAFSAGIGLPLLLVALSSGLVTKLLARLKSHLPKVEFVTGVGLLLFGVQVLGQAWSQAPLLTDTQTKEALMAVADGGEKVSLDRAQANGAKMVFFYSEHCPICRAMEKFLPEFEKDCTADGFSFVRVNTDSSENFVAATKFQIRAVPTISLIAADGTEVSRLIGYQTQARLREAAQALNKVACRTEPSKEDRPEMPGLKSPEPGLTCHVGESC